MDARRGGLSLESADDDRSPRSVSEGSRGVGQGAEST